MPKDVQVCAQNTVQKKTLSRFSLQLNGFCSTLKFTIRILSSLLVLPVPVSQIDFKLTLRRIFGRCHFNNGLKLHLYIDVSYSMYMLYNEIRQKQTLSAHNI